MFTRFYTFLFFLALAQVGYGQLNMSLASQVQYNTDLNDVWGYVAPDSTEYALVGLRNGVSIVSLADPTAAVEVAFIPGQNSTWRDLKTWGHYAYVVTDQGGTTEGLTVINLENLPNEVSYFHWTPEIPNVGTLQRCHNLYIDEFGYAYLAGCNINSGGMVYVDVFSTPGQPIYAGLAPNRYAHDVYTRDNKMYASELYLGRMAIYDVSDKSNAVLLGTQQTPFEFTHNIWISDDGNYAFTTDELANAPIGSYDVSDPSDIIELDQFRPTATLGQSVIPHNVHVWQDWLIISYYTDGGIVADASRPHNVIEVGNFDTFFGGGAGFNGAWGAYPFLPSGLVLISDINSGLYVLNTNYVRGCYLEGRVTDAVTGIGVGTAEITIIADQPNIKRSQLNGDYATGLATAGTYEVTVTKPGYEPFSTTVTLDNGVLTTLNVSLQPLATFTKDGLVISENAQTPVPAAQILLANEESEFTFTANEDGLFRIENVYEGTYNIIAAAWGYRHVLLENVVINNNDAITIELPIGYQDDFAVDLDWQASATPDTRAGFWVREEPIGTYTGNSVVNPEFDVEGDIGDKCYVTGNGGGGVGDFDVDGGAVTLTSPAMQLASLYVNPVLEYNLWFWNGGGNGQPDDNLVVEVSNGVETVTVETVTQSGSFWRPRSSIALADFITITDDMRVSFTTSDFDASGHLVEAAVDAFAVTGEFVTSTVAPTLDATMRVLPNPFHGTFQLQYALEQWQDNTVLQIHNALGQHIETIQLNSDRAQLQLGERWPAGVYFLHLVAQSQASAPMKVVKQ